MPLTTGAAEQQGTGGGGGGGTTLGNDTIHVLELQETSGSTAFDATPDNQDFNITGCVLGQSGPSTELPNSYQFVSQDKLARSPAAYPTDKDHFTFAMWLNPTSTSGTSAVMRGGGGVNFRALYLRNGSMQIYDNGSYLLSTPISTGVWTHFVWTWNTNDDTPRFYKNSVLNDSQFYTSGRGTGGPQYGVDNYSQDYNGYMAQAAHWNRPLTQTEINDLYNSGTGLAYVNW